MGSSASSTASVDDLKKLEEEIMETNSDVLVYADSTGMVQKVKKPVRVRIADDPKASLKAATGQETAVGKDPEPILSELLESLLGVSSLVYSFSIFRDSARLKKVSVPVKGSGWFGYWPQFEEVELKGTETILTQDKKSEFPCQHLTRSLNANDWIAFIETNKEAYGRHSKEDTSETDKIITRAVLGDLTKDDGELVEFDDEFDSKELVYAITINHTDKRVVVTFRGSVMGGSDWGTNLSIPMRKIETPAVLVEQKFEPDIMIHGGFKSYLLGTLTSCDKVNPHPKLHCIIDNLTRVYDNPRHKGYDLYITGHSLGGALAALLAFVLAGSDKLKKVQHPITAVTFASPNVGGVGYLKGFQVLEKGGYLRHIRVSNKDDIINVSPPGLGWFGGLFSSSGYTQTGINIQLFAGRAMQIAYRGINRWFIDAIGIGNNKFHSLKTYRARLLAPENQSELDTLTVEKLYAKKELVRNLDD